MNFSIGNYWYLLLLLVLPVILLFIFQFLKWRKSRREAFAESRFQNQLFNVNQRFSKFFPVLYLFAFGFLILAMADIISGREEIKSKQKMNNVIFLLDVSNSMNAQDITPNRLENAKNIVVQSLEKMTNEKVGIILFAGEAQSIMPLTTDYSAVETYIATVETDAVQIQGTDFLKAMEVAVEKFKNVTKTSRKVILISDGEDNEGNETAAIDLAKKEGIVINTIGIGTEEGAPIPEYVYGQLMGYKYDMSGETVISRRQNMALKELAQKTGGSYTDGNNVNTAVPEILNNINKQSGGTETTVTSQNAVHYYQYLLGVSTFFFLLIYFFNPKRDFNL